jgi:DnaJ-domain-containing protein 1
MSISRRLFNMARSELNSLLDRAADWESARHSDRDPDEDLYRRYGLDELSDEQLEAELERRQRARAAFRAKMHQSAQPPPRSGAQGGARPGTSRPGTGRPAPGRPSPEDEVRRAYAALEVPPGSDFETVRKAYRTLMRKYHPDRHANSPEKQRAATELAQKLTQAYKLLEQRLRR